MIRQSRTAASPADATTQVEAPMARHRSGAVARMLRMPVATLRVWERRYGVTQPALSPSGQRLYSANDVRRLALLKQLTDLGHAIGSLASLDMEALRQVAGTHAGALASRNVAGPAASTVDDGAPWRVAVIGSSAGLRLQRATLRRQLARPLEVVGPYASTDEAEVALRNSTADALLLVEPNLQPGWLAQLKASAPGLATLPLLVLYRFANETTCAALATAGVRLMREPQTDTVIGQWLSAVMQALPRRSPPRERVPDAAAVPPRRWDDAALADVAGLSSTIACECPRHVAELLMQLSHFESYSAQCGQLSAADGELHAYLHQVASTARARFEAALEHVALHEGLILPPTAASAPAGTPAGTGAP